MQETTKSMVKIIARRRAIDLQNLSFCIEHKSRASDISYEGSVSPKIDLASQFADVNVHNVRLGGKT